MSKVDGFSSFATGLLVGVLGGVVAGLLCAPRSGEETRENIKQTAQELADKYSPEVQEIKKQALSSLDMIKYNIEKQYNKINNALKARQMAKAKIIENGQDELN